MSTDDFSVPCKVCGEEVNSFEQKIKYILIPDELVQERETIQLSCGCTVDFPSWEMDMLSGITSIVDFAGVPYVTFKDIQMIMEDE